MEKSKDEKLFKDLRLLSGDLNANNFPETKSKIDFDQILYKSFAYRNKEYFFHREYSKLRCSSPSSSLPPFEFVKGLLKSFINLYQFTDEISYCGGLKVEFQNGSKKTYLSKNTIKYSFFPDELIEEKFWSKLSFTIDHDDIYEYWPKFKDYLYLVSDELKRKPAFTDEFEDKEVDHETVESKLKDFIMDRSLEVDSDALDWFYLLIREFDDKIYTSYITSKKSRKGKLVNIIGVEEFHSALKDLFQEKSDELKRALNGEKLEEKLVFPSNANILVELFRRAHYNGKIVDNLTNIKDWICLNFSFLKKGVNDEKQETPEDFKEGTVKAILTGKSCPPPKKRLMPTLPFKTISQLKTEKEQEKDAIK